MRANVAPASDYQSIGWHIQSCDPARPALKSNTPPLDAGLKTGHDQSRVTIFNTRVYRTKNRGVAQPALDPGDDPFKALGTEQQDGEEICME